MHISLSSKFSENVNLSLCLGVFLPVLVLGGLGEGRGGGREEGLLLLRPHIEFSGVTILGSLFPQLSTLWFHWQGNIYFSCAFPPTFHFRHKCC